jgi:hypothetical protein
MSSILPGFVIGGEIIHRKPYMITRRAVGGSSIGHSAGVENIRIKVLRYIGGKLNFFQVEELLRRMKLVPVDLLVFLPPHNSFTTMVEQARLTDENLGQHGQKDFSDGINLLYLKSQDFGQERLLFTLRTNFCGAEVIDPNMIIQPWWCIAVCCS